jgi:iron complex transport system permease protein
MEIINKIKKIIIVVIGIILVAAGLTVATCVGSKNIDFNTVVNSIFHFDGSIDMILVRNARIPRAIVSFIIGGLLALCGSVMQGITRNPIAEPTVLGISQGATLAISFSSVFLGTSQGLKGVLMAMIGAILAGLAILLCSIKFGASRDISKLLLVGTAISTFTLSLASTIALIGNRSQELAFWLAGGLGNVTWEDVLILLFVGLTLGICLLFFAGKINVISLGDEVSLSLGVKPELIRCITILLMIPICAACVSVGGNIAYVGLIIPHIIRRAVTSDYRELMPISFLYGGALLVWADILAKMVNVPYETPVGLFTAILGVPFFLYLVRRERA